MGVEAKLQASDPPKSLKERSVYVQLNALNTVVIPHDLKHDNASQWKFATSGQLLRNQRVGDNEVVYFVDGWEALPQFQWEIEQTSGGSDFIYLLGWYLDINFVLPDYRAPHGTKPDGSQQIGKSMKQLLLEAGKRNVQIRVMLDGCPHNPFVNSQAVNFLTYGLDAAAGPPEPPPPDPPPPYELIEPRISQRNPEYDAYMKNYNARYKNQIDARRAYLKESRRNSSGHPDSAGVLDGKYAPPLGCHHQKILLVKHGRCLTAFCGGVDVNPDRVSKTEAGRPMHDVHCRIRGPAAWDVLQIFLDRWDDYVTDTHDDDDGVDPLDEILADKRALRGQDVKYVPPCGKFSVQIARTTGHILTDPYKFAPGGERSIRLLVQNAIQNAKRFIYIEDQYLVNLEVAEWLKAQLGQIKHVTILVPPPELTSPPSYVNTRRRFIEKVKEGGADKVRVFCLKNDEANEDGNTVCSTYIHSKTWIFDDKFAIIGSANCNNRGMKHDSEVSAGIFDPSDDAQLTYTLPHRLRMRLWGHHLGIDEGELADGVASADLWKQDIRPASARVREYEVPSGLAPLRRADSMFLGWWVEDTL